YVTCRVPSVSSMHTPPIIDYHTHSLHYALPILVNECRVAFPALQDLVTKKLCSAQLPPPPQSPPAPQVADTTVHYLPLLATCGADRKSTRLNSSHEWISYAVFCLQKKRTLYLWT